MSLAKARTSLWWASGEKKTDAFKRISINKYHRSHALKLLMYSLTGHDLLPDEKEALSQTPRSHKD